MNRVDDASIQAFFAKFVEDFAHFDGALIAQRYLAPYLSVRADGGLAYHLSTADIAAYFQSFLNQYHALGVRYCRYTELEWHPVAACGAVATVTWVLLGASDNTVSRWRESYHLVNTAEGLRVFAAMDH